MKSRNKGGHEERQNTTAATQHRRSRSEPVYLGSQTYDKIWKPDFYFPDALNVVRPVVNTGDSLQLRLSASGSVSLSLRLMTEFR